MYKQLMKPIIFVITSIVTILPQVSIAAPKGFQSPSGNVFCELITEEKNSLRCEISSSLKPQPPEPYPGYCEFDWGMGFLLPADAKPEILCISDTIANQNKPVLAYGRTWNNNGFKCVSQKTGLTCTNKSGIGFFLSREKWGVLGLSQP
jgi:hypothetical protein